MFGETIRNDKIKENIPSIVDVQRIVVKRNNMEIKTNTLILTFNTHKIPESLSLLFKHSCLPVCSKSFALV